MLTVDVIQCNRCNDIIYSRARHDFHSCYCGRVSIDGGLEDTHIFGSEWTFVPGFQIDATERQLFKDWNLGTNKFGWYRPEHEEQ